MPDTRFTPLFWKIYDAAMNRPRYISLPGGTRSGKTYAVLQLLHRLIPKADKAGDVTSVVSETLPHLKRGAIRDFERIIGHPLNTDTRWNATDLVYTYDNGAKLEFFSVDSPGKVLGPARKRLFINECNHIPYETARQLFVRTTGLIFLDYNPAATFWAIERIENRDNCVTIHSTYKDNTFLTKEQVAEIESNKNDTNWWKVYGEGLLGTLDGVILNFEQIDTMPDPDGFAEIGGMDFGFTDPTAIVRILANKGKKEAYIQQIAYQRHLHNEDISAILIAAKLPKGVRIWADAAEPKSIEEIAADTGLNVKKCDKSAPVKSDRRKFQIQWLQGWRLFVTKDSIDVIRELRNYTWEKDKDGNITSTPTHEFSHSADAIRYALFSEFAGRKGNYCISIL